MSRQSFGGRRHSKRRREHFDDAAGAADDKDDAFTGGPLRQREAYMRMNFLFQAAHLTATGPAACLPLSRFYAATMRKIGTRLTIRSNPALKCDTCKVCHSLLTPNMARGGDGGVGGVVDVNQLGSSVSLHTASRAAEPALIRTCRCCGTQRRVGLKRLSKRRVETQATEREQVTPTPPQHEQPSILASITPQPAATAVQSPVVADVMR